MCSGLEKNISSLILCYRVVPIKLGKVIKSEANNKKNMFLQTLNIEWGQG